MPWPAKPPMTLKEAKRAYKRDGATVRYTASQMARADRIDAREEKRKKELERNRQRVENKRKREEKAERERTVRQKMLEEGRISIEDTWGKVTASQPRLNRFFGQKAVGASVKGKRDREDLVSADKESALTEEIVANDISQGLRDAVQEEIPITVSEAALAPPRRTAAPTLTSPDKSQPVQAKPSPLGDDRPAVLRVLTSSQANARSSAPAGTVNKSHCGPPPSCAELPRSSLPFSLGSAISPRDTGHSLLASPLSAGRDVVSAGSSGSPTELLPARVGIDAGREKGERKGHRLEHSTPEQEGFNKTVTAGAQLPQSSLDVEDDEDFTDGIDDATFLMLCATQKPIRIASSTPNHEPPTSPTSSVDTRICSSPKEDSRVEPGTRTSRTTQATIKPSKELSESFNSVFNEIEDEDLLALAVEVEAQLATTKQTPTEAPAAKSAKVEPPPLAQQQPLRSRGTPKRRPAAPRGRAKVTRQEAPSQETTAAAARTPTSQDCAEETAKLKVNANLSRAYTTPRIPGVAGSGPSDSQAIESSGKASWKIARATGMNIRAMDSNPRAAVSAPRVNGLTPSSGDPKAAGHSKTVSPSRPRGYPPKPSPTPSPWPKPVKRHRYPWDVSPVDEFPGLGPSTQALSLELLAQVEAQIRDEERKLQTR
ncbi:hypothetical protein CLCR_03362 [Cladophialophora carrionii]|uniref:Uncharacterized protein n=1 Tax=Cladophialophora carrionii TaxID=86049 RepID=A0A1C1CH39_9EURO|nr:hypothetical protein CLCR_03362 [Cladophialophora carrionii]